MIINGRHFCVVEDMDEKWFNNDDFFMSSEIHPKKLRMCAVDSKEKDSLLECKWFRYEEDYEEGENTHIVCRYALCSGFKSQCERVKSDGRFYLGD